MKKTTTTTSKNKTTTTYINNKTQQQQKNRKLIPVSGKMTSKSENTQRTAPQNQDQMGLDATKPIFGVSDKPRLKLVSSATETS